MALLSAVVPLLTEKRSELVPARLARKVAPLFGVPWERNPFGSTTWLCDFNTITLSEIARGAPSPTRTETARLRGTTFDRKWVFHNRAVVPGSEPSLPNEIVNATMNRFGPDTKSAVLLTAANALFEPVVEAMNEVIPLLRGTSGELHPALRVTAWATVVIEAFRSQPALVTAACKARSIQRTLLATPQFPRAGKLSELTLARCEIGARMGSGQPDPVTHPKDFRLVDHTLGEVDLAGQDGLRHAAELGFGFGELGAGRLRGGRHLRAELANHLVGLLLDAAEPDGVGYVWISEREPGQVVAEALLPSDTIIGALLAQVSAARGSAGTYLTTPMTSMRIPEPREVAGFGELACHVLVLAAIGAVRRQRPAIGQPELPIQEFLAELAGIIRLVDELLEPDDPVAIVARWRLSVLRLDALYQDGVNDVSEPVTALLDNTERGLGLLGTSSLDRGAIADLVAASCIELNSVRTRMAGRAPDGAARSDLDSTLRRYWAGFAEAVEVDLDELDPDKHCALGFHLHNYAAFLGSHADSPDDLRQSIELFDNIVIPFRKQLHERIGAAVAFGRSLYLAARSAALLGEHDRLANQITSARKLADQSLSWIRWVLDRPEFQTLVSTPSADTIPFALSVAPGLLLALELESRPEKEWARQQLDRLIDATEAAFALMTGGSAQKARRYPELARIRKSAMALSHRE